MQTTLLFTAIQAQTVPSSGIIIGSTTAARSASAATTTAAAAISTTVLYSTAGNRYATARRQEYW
jgi:hypothetical protein